MSNFQKNNGRNIINAVKILCIYTETYDAVLTGDSVIEDSEWLQGRNKQDESFTGHGHMVILLDCSRCKLA